MADFISTARSETFKVKDPAALRADLAAWGIDYDVEVHEDTAAGDGAVYLICRSDHGDWPIFEEDWVADRIMDARELDEDQVAAALAEPPHFEEVGSIEDLIAFHLVDDEVAVLMSVGHEKMRYVDGYAVAVNARGEKRTIVLSHIHQLARELKDSGE